MKVNNLRVASNKILDKYGPGTGKHQGLEIYPMTKRLMDNINLPNEMQTILLIKQNTILEKEPDLDSYKNLRAYQQADVQFLAARKSAACFNEQRTGKTPTSLVTMKVKGVEKLLIVAPASTLYSWKEECKKWWFGGLDIQVVDGPASKRKEILDNWNKGARIISYECLRETNHTTRNEQGEIEEMYMTGDLAYIKKHTDIQGIILDEAHRIKNHKSKQALALFSLKDIPHKLALTGTPAPGKQHEIYSILHWLYPTIFSGYWRFIEYYFTQYEQYTSTRKFKVIGTFKHGMDTELQQFLSAVSTRRMRASVMQWLPEKDKQIIKLPQTKEQLKYIKELNETFEIEGTNVDAINILAKLVKIRQILLAPELLELKGKSPKIEWIKQYIADYPDKRIIIFSNFTEWLKLLGKELGCENFIIGETTKKRRQELIVKFQSGVIKLLLINIKAGKEGITLDSADVAIFTDKYPPVGDIQQAEDRMVATTKDKLDTGHTIIDLVMDQSYEVNILQMLESNASEVDIINNYVEYLKGSEQ